MKRTLLIVCVLYLLLSAFGNTASAAENVNWAKALQLSLHFYDAEKCGHGISGGRLEWRGDCHTEDGKFRLSPENSNLSEEFINRYRTVLDPDGDGLMDLSGGYHDAGDHVRFGMPQSYAASTLAWGFYEFRAGYVKSGQYDHMVDILKWFADCYLKTIYRDANGDVVAFAYMVGDGSVDHTYWGPPELQCPIKFPRSADFATAETPASDVSAGVSAFLALMYLNFKDTEPAYAQTCLDYATALYEFATTNRGLGNGDGFYGSSYDEDELAWACVWLHLATGEKHYIDQIVSYDAAGLYTGWMKKIISTTENTWQNIWTHCWDTIWGGVFTKLSHILPDEKYDYFARWNIEYWSGGTVPHQNSADTNYLAQTPAGYGMLNNWGSARYNTAAQLCALVYHKHKNRPDMVQWAKGQMEYIFGKNPMNRCYQVGYGLNSAQNPHHRASHGSKTNSALDPEVQKHVLWGALVGGPDADDNHVDSTNDYIYNEVAIDYNAAFTGALAAYYELFGAAEAQQPLDDFPPAEEPEDEFFVETKLEQENNERSQVTIRIHNETARPPRFVNDIKVRYFFDIAELLDAGQSIKDVRVEVYYDQHATVSGSAVSVSGPVAWNVEDGKGIYYVEFDWSGPEMYGDREFQFALITKQDSQWTSHWDGSNDYSREGMTSEYAKTDKVPLYQGDTLVTGTEPDKGPDEGDNNVPVATATATPTSGEAPLEVLLSASGSSDPDGDTLTYTWDFGDSQTGSGVTSSHTYTKAGTYTAKVTVSDGELSSTAAVAIHVTDPDSPPDNHPPKAKISATPTSGQMPLTVDFSAADSSDADGDSLTYTWAFGDGGSDTGVEAQHTYTAAGKYSAAVTVSDSQSSDTATIEITVQSEETGGVVCEYIVTNEWNTGFTANIRLTNNSTTPVDGWDVSWAYTDGSKPTYVWNANVSGENPYAATPLDWNSRVSPGQSVEFGLVGEKATENAAAQVPQVTGDVCGSPTPARGR